MNIVDAFMVIFKMVICRAKNSKIIIMSKYYSGEYCDIINDIKKVI